MMFLYLELTLTSEGILTGIMKYVISREEKSKIEIK
jgi:hypothetical protein